MDNRSNMEPAAQNANAGKRYAEFRFLFLVLQGVGCTLIILTFYWIFAHLGGLSWSSKPSVQFNWHPLLMTIGMIYLYGNSILVYRGLRFARKRSLKLCHASIFGSIMILVLIASLAVFDSHNLAVPPIPNLYSLHSWVGLTAVTLFILQWIGGFFSYLYPVVSAQQREAFMPTHIFFGLAGYVTAVAAAVLGVCEKAIFKFGPKDYSQLPSEAVLVNCIGLLIIIFAALVVYLATHRNYKRIPLPEDAILLTGHNE